MVNAFLQALNGFCCLDHILDCASQFVLKFRVRTKAAVQVSGKQRGDLLAFILISTRTIAGSRQVATLGNLPEIEEMHSITGENGMLLKVRTADAQALEQRLAKIQSVAGVDKTTSIVALSTLLERGTSPEL